MRQDRLLDIVARIDVDAPHELDDLSRFSQVVAAGLVDRLANELEGHFQLSRFSDTQKLGLPLKH